MHEESRKGVLPTRHQCMLPLYFTGERAWAHAVHRAAACRLDGDDRRYVDGHPRDDGHGHHDGDCDHRPCGCYREWIVATFHWIGEEPILDGPQRMEYAEAKENISK